MGLFSCPCHVESHLSALIDRLVATAMYQTETAPSRKPRNMQAPACPRNHCGRSQTTHSLAPGLLTKEPDSSSSLSKRVKTHYLDPNTSRNNDQQLINEAQQAIILTPGLQVYTQYLLWGLKYINMTYFGLFGGPGYILSDSTLSSAP